MDTTKIISIKDYWLEDPISTSNVFKVLENKQQMDEAVNENNTEIENVQKKF